MSHKDCYNLSVDGEFLAKLAVALAKHSEAVIAEDSGVASHAERLVLAMKVLVSPDGYARQVALASAAHFSGIMPSDEDVDALVAQYWTPLALAP